MTVLHYPADTPTDIVKGIIKEAMNKRGVETKEIPTEKPFNIHQRKQLGKRSFEAKGRATFKCSRCRNKWSSFLAWCIMDLKTTSICYRYSQDCRKCKKRKIQPNFPESSLTAMAEYVVSEFLYKMGWITRPPKPKTARRIRNNVPHYTKGCEKCRLQKKKCYK